MYVYIILRTFLCLLKKIIVSCKYILLYQLKQLNIKKDFNIFYEKD